DHPRPRADLPRELGPAARGQPVRAPLCAARPAGHGRGRLMRILQITAGAGGMYCGSCLRDNTLAAETMALGHEVSLLPVYTPTLTDEPNVSEGPVFYGGVSVYLPPKVPLFPPTPPVPAQLWGAPPA